MKKGDLFKLMMVGVLSSSIVGCEKNSEVEEEKNEEPLVVAEEVSHSKVFKPYEHVFFERHYYGVKAMRVTGGQIVIPEGYEILEIENFNEQIGYGSQTAGFDVWYTNNEEVEVLGVVNEETGEEEFTSPGVVVSEDEKGLVYKK